MHMIRAEQGIRMTRKPDFKKASKSADIARKSAGPMPPFDPEQVAEDMGIDVVYADLLPPHDELISGFYRSSDNKIVINKKIHPSRMIFTIAHELGHVCMHQNYIKSKNYQPVFRSNYHFSTKPPEEIEADTFAANFLVPLDVLKRYRDVADVTELAEMFAVSVDVIYHRLDLLDRYPGLAKKSL